MLLELDGCQVSSLLCSYSGLIGTCSYLLICSSMQYPKTCKEIKHANKILIWDKRLSYMCMGIPFEYMDMGHPMHTRMGQYTHMGQNSFI